MQTANRVAINTVIQYVKLIVNVLVGLISVRVLLNALGAEDYGIYDVVGGVIALLAFINSSLSQSSIRFLSVSLGKRDINDTRTVFNNCFWIHLLVSIIIALIFETIGSLLFHNFLNIPAERLGAAKSVYHFMVIILFLQISITPFNALIISHEKFVFSSVVSIIDSLLKLSIAFVIKYVATDKLMLYGGLMAGVTVINSILSIIYSFLLFKNEIFIGRLSFRGIKELVTFVGWTILDVVSQLSTRQGYSIMFNKFFGPAINAVYALSRQIEGNFYYLSASVIDSMKPQIMKSYGDGNTDRMIRLSLTSGKLGFFMISILAIPFLVMMPTILKLWLVNVPEGTVFFARMMLLACMVEQLTKGMVYTCQATGNIKLFSIIISFIRFLALPISIICLYFGAEPSAAMIIYLICETTGSFSRVIIISKITDFKTGDFIKSVFLKILPPVIVLYIISYGIYRFNSSIVTCMLNLILTSIIYAVLFYVISLDRIEKQSIKSLVNSFLSKIRR